MAGDGQVTLGSEVLKSSAKKLRRLYNSKILAGFAGATADAFALFTRFETKLEQFNGNLSRAPCNLYGLTAAYEPVRAALPARSLRSKLKSMQPGGEEA